MRSCDTCGTDTSVKWYKKTTCARCYNKSQYDKNRLKILAASKEKYQANPTSKLAYEKRRYEENREDVLKEKRDQYAANPNPTREYQKEMYQKHRVTKLKYQLEYEKNRFKVDLHFLLKKRVRTRMKMAMKGNYKTGIAIDNLGSTIEELKLSLESMFTSDMTWQNYGLVWEIDHIRPLASFDLQNPEDLRAACNIKNLQPILKIDHYLKSRQERKRDNTAQTL